YGQHKHESRATVSRLSHALKIFSASPAIPPLFFACTCERRCQPRRRDYGGAVQCVTSNVHKGVRQMKVKTNVEAGGINIQHNQTVARGLKVKANVKAGKLTTNHNQTTAKRSEGQERR